MGEGVIGRLKEDRGMTIQIKKDFACTAPIIAFHGTQASFDSFITPAWFSNDFQRADLFSAEWSRAGVRNNSSKVITALITIEHAFITDDWCVIEPCAQDQQAWMQGFIDQGYDGIIFTNPDSPNEVEFVVFHPDQIEICKNKEM